MSFIAPPELPVAVAVWARRLEEPRKVSNCKHNTGKSMSTQHTCELLDNWLDGMEGLAVRVTLVCATTSSSSWEYWKSNSGVSG
jgi:hypothetical protein